MADEVLLGRRGGPPPKGRQVGHVALAEVGDEPAELAGSSVMTIAPQGLRQVIVVGVLGQRRLESLEGPHVVMLGSEVGERLVDRGRAVLVVEHRLEELGDEVLGDVVALGERDRPAPRLEPIELVGGQHAHIFPAPRP